MSITRKTVVWALLATLPTMGLHCHSYPEPACEAQYLGGLSLRPASLAWLPAPAPDSLRFINSNGFRAVLDRVMLPAAPDSVTLPALPDARSNYLERTLTQPLLQLCQPYYRARRVGWHYQGRNLNIDLRLNLLKYPGSARSGPAGPLTRAVADTLPDVVTVSFAERYFADFPVVQRPYRQARTTDFGRVTYLDSIQLAGRTFFGVYQFSRTPYDKAVQPEYFFFRPGQGLVGFIYTNNEQWGLL